MDAVRFLKEVHRMCEWSEGCVYCPLRQYSLAFPCKFSIGVAEHEFPDEIVDIVAKWSEEHTDNTRQKMFLKTFPSAVLDEEGVVSECPAMLGLIRKDDEYCHNTDCSSCRKQYWLEEID